MKLFKVVVVVCLASLASGFTLIEKRQGWGHKSLPKFPQIGRRQGWEHTSLPKYHQIERRQGWDDKSIAKYPPTYRRHDLASHLQANSKNDRQGMIKLLKAFMEDQ